MYDKFILIIFVILFLLYLWNNITEMFSEEISFTLLANMYHDKVFFKVATILTLEDMNDPAIKIDLTNSKYDMGNIIQGSSHKAMEYFDSDNVGTPQNTPYFTYNENKLTINNVNYVSGTTDIFPYYCKNKEVDFDSSFVWDKEKPLFRTRLAALTKVTDGLNFSESQNIDSLVDNTIIIKLLHIDDYDFLPMLLEPDYNLLKYFSDISENEKIIMYIYEGLDNDEISYPLDDNIYEQLMKIDCSDIMNNYGVINGAPMLGKELLKNIPPTWSHNKLFDHIHNIELRQDHSDGIYLKLLLGENMYLQGDPEYKYLNDTMFKKHIMGMKYNIIFFHYQLQNLVTESNSKMLEYITLDITDLPPHLPDLKNVSRSEIRRIFRTIFDGNLQKNNTDIHHMMDIGIDNIQQMIHKFSIGVGEKNRTYIRLPYFIDMCSQDSELVGILTSLVLEKKGEYYYISYTDVCRYDNDSQSALGTLKTSPEYQGSLTDKNGNDTQKLIENDFT